MNMRILSQIFVIKRLFGILKISETGHADVFRTFASGLIKALESPSEQPVRARIRAVRHG